MAQLPPDFSFQFLSEMQQQFKAPRQKRGFFVIKLCQINW